MTGRLECDIIEVNRWEGAKTVCFFLTGIINIYILYYGFIQTVFAPLVNELFNILVFD